MAQTLHELFNVSLPKKLHIDNLIEVTDFYDCEYGSIFYKGKEIRHFEGENYYDMLQSYSTIKKLKALGVDVDKAQFILYQFALLKEHTFPHFDHHQNQFSSYQDLVRSVELDIIPIQQVIKIEEVTYNILTPFITIQPLEL